MSRFFALGFIVVLLGACSSPSQEDLLREPLELHNFISEAKISKVWRQNLGKGQHKGFGKLQPVVFADALYVADAGGAVYCLDKKTGKQRWKVKLKDAVKSGVGVGGDAVYVGLDGGVLVALSKANGTELWRVDLEREILAPAAANQTVAAVQTASGAVIGMDASTGAELWQYQSVVPPLSVRGTSTPLIVENFVFVGLANGKLVALDNESGAEVWARRLASPSGASELERITDVDSTPLLLGGRIVAGSYNGNVAMIDGTSGQPFWMKEAKLAGEASEGFGNIYFATGAGELVAHDASNGQLKWVNEDLLRRGLGGTATWVNYVAVADYEGYLHLISQVDGEVVARKRIDDELPRASIFVDGGLLYVLGNAGELTAYSVKSLL